MKAFIFLSFIFFSPFILSSFIPIDFRKLPKTFYLNNFLNGFMQGYSSTYQSTSTCMNNSIDNSLEVFMINSLKHLTNLKNPEEFNKTINLLQNSFEMLLKEILQSCEIKFDEKEEKMGFEEIKNKGEQILKEFIDGIQNFNGDSYKIINYMGKIIGFMFKASGKTNDIVDNIWKVFQQ